MNKHVFFPPQDYKHCSFFLFCWEQHPFFYSFFFFFFTGLILENRFPLKCNILKQNRGRLTERPTAKSSPTRSLARGWLGGRFHQEPALKPKRQRKIDWQAPRQSSAKEWQRKVTDTKRKKTKTHSKQSSRFQKWKRPTSHSPYREHQQNQKNTSYHIERVLFLRWQHLILALKSRTGHLDECEARVHLSSVFCAFLCD